MGALARPATRNTVGQPPSYQDGLVYYTINHTSAKGCVTDYSLWKATTPTQGQRDLLTLVAGIYLPADAQQVVNQDTCMVWSSTQLAKTTDHQ